MSNHGLSQQTSAAYDGSQLPPNRPVLCIEGVVVHLQHVNISQYNSVPYSPWFTRAVLAYCLSMQQQEVAGGDSSIAVSYVQVGDCKHWHSACTSSCMLYRLHDGCYKYRE